MTSSSPIVLIATCADYPELFGAEQLLIPAFRRRGVDARPAVWTDPGVDWEAASLVLIRSTWDYFVRYDEFLTWLRLVEDAAEVVNPAALIRWNSHKSYLAELSERGIPIIETVWLPKGRPASLESILDERGWGEGVIKPAISGAARGALRVRIDQRAEGNRALAALLSEGDAMVQPYVSNLAREGEVAAMFVQGELTHAVTRPSALDHGSAAGNLGGQRRELSVEESAFAHTALRAISPRPLYARVDMVRADDGSLRLLELEMIEPNLFLALAPEALERLTDAVAQLLAPIGQRGRPPHD